MSDIRLEQSGENTVEENRTATLRNTGKLSSRRRLRYLLDRAAQSIISLGGIGVMVTLLLLFVFLFSEVAPLFRSATIESAGEFVLDDAAGRQTLHLAMEEQTEIGFQLFDDGSVIFFGLPDGAVLSRESLALPRSALITEFATAEEESGFFAVGLSTGSIVVAAHDYETDFVGADNTRTITPFLTYPLGNLPPEIFGGSAITQLALSSQESSIVLAAINDQNRLSLLRGSRQRSLISSIDPDASAEFEIETLTFPRILPATEKLFIDGDQRRIILLHPENRISVVDIAAAFLGSAAITEFELDESEGTPDIAKLLLGGLSLLTTDSEGGIHQYFFASQS
ncbi:MAG: hypothetical protein MI746_00695 [Pseudomonadales bacterium]|nr:hypothetical protein [Pseudomonadales bacterium]